MEKSLSLPKPKTKSENGKSKLPKLTKNSWLTNSSKNSNYKYLKGSNTYNKKYDIRNREILNGGKPGLYDQLNAIENNYYEMKFLLNDKINRLEKNQRKVNDFLKYSLEQDRLQNDINHYNYNKYIKNYQSRKMSEKDHILNMLDEIPRRIENKFGKLYLKELEESRSQRHFFANLKEKMAIELDKQRRYDYLKYQKKIEELMLMKDNEEREKMLLYNQLEKQKILNKIQAMKYQNELIRYQAYGGLPLLNNLIGNLGNIGNFNNNNKQDNLGLSINELIKIFLFKEMLGTSRINNEYENLLLNSPFKFRNKYDILLDSYINYRRKDDTYNKYRKLKHKNRSFIFNNRYKDSYNLDEYSTYGKKVPFINSGKSYSKIDITNNNKKRFGTIHNKRDTKEKIEDLKAKKKSNTQKSKKTKSSHTPSGSVSGSGSDGSKSENENDSKSNNSNTNSENESEEKEDNKKKSKKKKTEEEDKSDNNDEDKENNEDNIVDSSESNSESNNEENKNTAQPPPTSQQMQSSQIPQSSQPIQSSQIPPSSQQPQTSQ